ncbi:MAG: hypothetical protein C5B49_09905 [Bdellovibrio sp.]|nr:MAG: hypothetical protein C5B49_09905 [Bdellovibrio sp.]
MKSTLLTLTGKNYWAERADRNIQAVLALLEAAGPDRTKRLNELVAPTLAQPYDELISRTLSRIDGETAIAPERRMLGIIHSDITGSLASLAAAADETITTASPPSLSPSN